LTLPGRHPELGAVTLRHSGRPGPYTTSTTLPRSLASWQSSTATRCLAGLPLHPQWLTLSHQAAGALLEPTCCR
jgi:hypothetical protein